jgi:hypothetical protein
MLSSEPLRSPTVFGNSAVGIWDTFGKAASRFWGVFRKTSEGFLGIPKNFGSKWFLHDIIFDSYYPDLIAFNNVIYDLINKNLLMLNSNII